MMMFFRKLAAFIKKDFFIHTSYRLYFILTCVGAFFYTVTFYFISKLIGTGITPHLKEYGGQYFPFVLVGLAFYSYLSTSLRTFSMSVREEQMMGTLEALFLTPTKISTIIISMSCWDFIFSTLNASVCLFLGVFFLGVKFINTSFIAIFLILVLTIIASASIGIISAAFIMVFKKGDPIAWAMNLFSAFFAGVYFPVAILPKGLRFISNFLPFTYSLRAMRHALLNGYGLKALLPDIFILLLFSIILLPISILIFKYTVKKAKIVGSLAHY